MQSALVLFILAVTWSIYLVMWLISQRERHSMNSIATFNKHLAVLSRTAPAGTPPAGHQVEPGGMTLADARNRRRQVLTSLAAAASITAVGAFGWGGLLVAVHLMADALLAGYVLGLIHARRTGSGHPSTVLYLPRQVTPVAIERAYLQRPAN